ncbi:Phosphatidylserine decarboxylase proenzyme [Buchnera aphidicola (Neophyllaphis podocarpi)]|uniref:archaetidylserine decarboxylase n=1 Tax=Buchnera aphidicola TaxID=9 RepID=UPI0034639F33
MFNFIKLFFLNLTQKRFFSFLFVWFANKELGYITSLSIRFFVWFYKINIFESKNNNISNYKTFNDFFIRLLDKKFRPVDFNNNILTFPSDGIINQIGRINKDQIFQAKDNFYSLESLLAGNSELSYMFYKGSFINIHLSPGDCHRVYMPYQGLLKKIIYVPSNFDIFNKFSSNNTPNLFTNNERIICVFETNFGSIVNIFIGSAFIRSIKTIWLDKITSFSNKTITTWHWNENKEFANLFKGQEIGYFNIGSTIINLFPSNKVKFLENLKVGSRTKFGSAMCYLLDDKYK